MTICFSYKIDENFYLSIKIFYQNNLYDNYMQRMYCFYDLNKNKIFTGWSLWSFSMHKCKEFIWPTVVVLSTMISAFPAYVI